MDQRRASSTRQQGAARARIASAWPVLRILAAALIAAAAIAQLTRTVGNAIDSETAHGGHLPTVIWNFLSFFTIESNIASVIVLAVGAIWAWTRGRGAGTEPGWLAILLACTTTYMLVTGLVYNLLLRGVPLPQGVTVPWSNEVLHVVGPVLMLLDLLFAPRRRALPWGAIGIVAAFPILWAVYTLLRANLIVAPATGDAWWYPYPFLDPHLVPGGYLGVAGYIVGIAVAICAAAWFVVWVGRRRGAVATPGADTGDGHAAGTRDGEITGDTGPRVPDSGRTD